MGSSTSANTSGVTFKSTFTAATPCKEGGIGVKFSNTASAGCSKG